MAEELTLDDLRKAIDALDEQIVRLLNERARCAFAVGRIKQERGMTIYEPAREAVVIAHVRTVNDALGGPLTADAIERLYERVMDEARRIQRLEFARRRQQDETES